MTLAEKVARIHRDGGTLKRVMPDGRTKIYVLLPAEQS